MNASKTQHPVEPSPSTRAASEGVASDSVQSQSLPDVAPRPLVPALRGDQPATATESPYVCERCGVAHRFGGPDHGWPDCASCHGRVVPRPPAARQETAPAADDSGLAAFVRSLTTRQLAELARHVAEYTGELSHAGMERCDSEAGILWLRVSLEAGQLERRCIHLRELELEREAKRHCDASDYERPPKPGVPKKEAVSPVKNTAGARASFNSDGRGIVPALVALTSAAPGPDASNDARESEPPTRAVPVLAAQTAPTADATPGAAESLPEFPGEPTVERVCSVCGRPTLQLVCMVCTGELSL